MKDTIYREDAINCLCNGKCLDEMRWCDDGYCPPVTRIKQLPSAQPETCAYWDGESNFCALHRPSAQPKRSQGKWIDEGQHADFFPHHAYRCSECGHHLLEIVVTYDFCPFCGADMRGEQ